MSSTPFATNDGRWKLNDRWTAMIMISGMAFVTATATAHSAPKVGTVDFSSCATSSFFFGQPVGNSIGNAQTKDSMLRFVLSDPALGNNVWFGDHGGASIDVSVSIQSPTTVNLLLNTGDGQPNITNAIVTLKGTNGAQMIVKMKGNVTIRDYNNWYWTETINDTTTQEWWTNNLNPQPGDQSKRLDVHVFRLGANFVGQTLTDIIVTAPPKAADGYMVPMLSAVSVAYPGAGGAVPSSCVAH